MASKKDDMTTVQSQSKLRPDSFLDAGDSVSGCMRSKAAIKVEEELTVFVSGAHTHIHTYTDKRATYATHTQAPTCINAVGMGRQKGRWATKKSIARTFSKTTRPSPPKSARQEDCPASRRQHGTTVNTNLITPRLEQRTVEDCWRSCSCSTDSSSASILLSLPPTPLPVLRRLKGIKRRWERGRCGLLCIDRGGRIWVTIEAD